MERSVHADLRAAPAGMRSSGSGRRGEAAFLPRAAESMHSRSMQRRERVGAARRALTGMRGFITGFTTPWAGLMHMNRHPALWRDAILPMLLNLVLTTLFLVGLVVAAVHSFNAIYGWLDGLFPEGWWVILEVLAGIVLGLAVAVVVLGLAIAGWLVFQGILCGYFYSELARKVEIQLGLKPEQMREVPLRYQVVDALLDLGTLTLVAVGCLALNIIPVVGPVAAVVLGIYFDCFVFGMDYLDYPQALRARNRKVQRQFARRHRASTLGLGSSVMIITFIPIVNSVFLTTAAVGAVLLYRQLAPDEQPVFPPAAPAVDA